MSKFPRILATFLPLTLVLACGDDTPADDDGTGSETAGDGDGDPTGDGDGDPTGDGDGDPTGDGDGDPTGDGDGDPTGDGDGDPTGDGDGDPTGDGDGDPDVAQLRVLHLGVDAPPVDVYVDGAVDPAVAGLAFQSGTAYLDLAPGLHSVTVTPTGDPNTTVLQLDDLDLAAMTMYSAVAYDYLADISALLLTDDATGLDPANTRVQVSHTAPDVDQVDIWVLSDPPALLIENLDYAATTSVDIPAGPAPIGIDVDDDMNPDLIFDIPDLGGGTFVDLYAVNEAGGTPVFLLAHLPDGSTARIDTTVCGNGIQQGAEVCDGDDFGGQSCSDFGFDGGSLTCANDCSAFDQTACFMEFSACYDMAATDIPDGGNPNNAVTLPIVVADLGTVVDVRVSLDVTHTNLTDLDVRLDRNGANNTATDIMRDIQAIGGGLCTGDDIVATFADNATESIQTEACTIDATPAVDGTYLPEEALDNYDGLAMNATWNLRVDDDSNGETGAVNNWCIYIGYQPIQP